MPMPSVAQQTFDHVATMRRSYAMFQAELAEFAHSSQLGYIEATNTARQRAHDCLDAYLDAQHAANELNRGNAR